MATTKTTNRVSAHNPEATTSEKGSAMQTSHLFGTSPVATFDVGSGLDRVVVDAYTDAAAFADGVFLDVVRGLSDSKVAAACRFLLASPGALSATLDDGREVVRRKAAGL